MNELFRRFANRTSEFTGSSWAFIISIAIIAIWGITGPMFHYSDTWQLIINTGTTIVTFLIVFLIQNSQNRDAAAMQAKLDELIRAVREARGQFIGIEHRTDKEIMEIRELLEEECAKEEEQNPSKPWSNTYLERLLSRH